VDITGENVMQIIPDYLNLARKAAVSLNNSAVALISRGFLREAMETLKDLVTIMKLASEPSTALCTIDEAGVEENESLWVLRLRRAQQ
jgi:hypothetical protein